MINEIVERMKVRKDMVNTLSNEEKEGRFNTRGSLFSQITSHSLQDFPKLSISDLKLFLTGTYQLSQAVCYLAIYSCQIFESR